MSTLDAIILGIVQGLTEFLPISSSGHLALFQTLLGLKDLNKYILFDLTCHLGTLLAIFFVYRSEIHRIIFKDSNRLLQIIIGILPLFPLLLIMKPIKKTFDQPEYLGYFFLTTALILHLGTRFSDIAKTSNTKLKSFRDPFIIGIFQALAIFPGISRSGSTISSARMLGWSRPDSVSFSFMLAIPTILGGAFIECLQLLYSRETEIHHDISTTAYIIGLITSFLVGYGALRLLMRMVNEDKLFIFVWYCLILGSSLILIF
ncbi:MAG: undecaprenyl-diphosphate phosphatase [Chlamydiota bacterium]|nr:undecaprenyl-diphosphate phosphatase [Chlamydiota bacterium]